MELLILKSAACLAILMVFYKLFLENLAIHKFKRLYLLGALVVSIVIPFITFVEYIEPAKTINFEAFKIPQQLPTNVVNEEPTNYLPIILWSIYGLGVLLFASKFCINLYSIVSKINKNEKLKQRHFISVLVNDLIVPHTFFSYIFLNKTKFEAKAIPKEVLLHEQTHASQKHSLDILLIELLQIVFWFNPLLYFIKKDIKLNHEFLADEAVLKQGIDSSAYQETLLQFTSIVNEIPLAHAINYSLIKKRFTIMKTKTSKKAIWLRSLLLLPLLGGLLFSFSGREQIEKEVLVPAMVFPNEMQDNDALSNVKKELSKTDNLKINYSSTPILELTQNPLSLKLNGKSTSIETLKQDFKEITDGKKTDLIINGNDQISSIFLKAIYSEIEDNIANLKFTADSFYASDGIVYINKKTILTINGTICDGCKLNLTKKGVEDLILDTTTGDNILSYKIKFPGYPTESIKGDALNNKAKAHLSKSNLGVNVTLFEIKTVKNEKLSPVIITLVDNNGEESLLPPPPPPPTKISQFKNGKKLTLNEIIKAKPKGVESGFEMLKNGESHYYTVHNGKKTYYNKDGYITDENGKVLPPPPPPPPPPAPPKPPKNKVSKTQEFPIPPPIPENATPEQRKKMQLEIDEFEKKYKRKVFTVKNTKTGEIHTYIINDEVYEGASDNCLKITEIINFSVPNTTLNIKCIEKYPKNELKIFNRHGILIYSKKGYNNSWDGKVESKFTSNKNGKAQTGTYYYIIDTGENNETLSGYLYVKDE